MKLISIKNEYESFKNTLERNLIELMGFNNIIKNYNNVLYYGGNGKLIIEYKNNIENKSLLIINPKNQLKENIFIIIKEQFNISYMHFLLLFNNIYEINCYEFLVPFNNFISNNNSPNHHQNNNINNYSPIYNKSNIKKDLYNNYITTERNLDINVYYSPTNRLQRNNKTKYNSYKKINNINYDTFSMNNQNKLFLSKNQDSFEKKLLVVFIYIYFYEKNLSLKKEHAFNQKQKYYLINPEWLNDYKNYYNYQKLYNLLSKQKHNNNSINYNNLDNNIDYIIKNYNFNKDILDFEKRELPEELNNGEKINCDYNEIEEISFISESIIFPFKIMDLIQMCNINISISIIPCELEFVNNNIFYIEEEKIIMGNLNDSNYFISKFIFIYDTLNIFEIERPKLLSNSFSINEYIKYSKSINNNKNYLILKNDENKTIGKLIMIKKNDIKFFSKTQEEFYKKKYFLPLISLNEVKNEDENYINQKKKMENQINILRKNNYDLQEKLKRKNEELNNLLRENVKIKRINSLFQKEQKKNNNIFNEYKKKKKEIEKREKTLSTRKIISNQKVNIYNQKKLKLKQKGNDLDKYLKNNNPIKKENKDPTLFGLKKIRNLPFMNSILQCLSQTKSLSNYFLKESNRNALQNKNKLQLSPLFLDIIQYLRQINRDKSYSNYDLKNRIEEINPLFKNLQENNIKDFIIFILENLHSELKKQLKSPLNDNPNFSVPNNEYEQNKVFNHFYREFQNECSIISDIFFGIYETTNICLNCKKNYNSKGLNNPIIYNYEIYNSIIFSLEEIKKYYQIDKDISLNDCFSYIQKDELLNEENQLKCKICKQKCDFIYKSKIYKSPNVLIIILERGKENNIKLKFNEILDITNFVSQKDEIKLIYNLYAVITCINKLNKYYIASCKSPINNKWYKYNDEKVTPINNIQKEIIDFEIPLVLFYERKN